MSTINSVNQEYAIVKSKDSLDRRTCELRRPHREMRSKALSTLPPTSRAVSPLVDFLSKLEYALLRTGN